MKTASKEWWNTPRGLTLNRTELDWRAAMQSTEPTLCAFDACDRPARKRGYCRGHIEQIYLGKPLRPLKRRTVGSVADRLDVYTDKSGDCWLWTGTVNDNGYGQMSVENRMQYVHRLSYELHVGPIGEGLVVDHMCHTVACLRPSHLQAVTQRENVENASVPITNRSGVRGVHYAKRLGKWTVQVKHRHIGVFDSLAEAERAAIAARNRVFTNNLADRAVQ